MLPSLFETLRAARGRLRAAGAASLLLAASPAVHLAQAAPAGPAGSAAAGTFHLERAAQGVRRLEVVSAAGDVRIRAQRAEQVVVDGVRTMGGDGCSVRLTGKAPTLQVEAKDPSGKPCSVELQVRLPQAVAIRVTGGTGNVFVSGVRAALQLELAQGNAVVGGTFPRFDAKLQQGSLSVQGLAGPAHMELGRGNLQMYAAPQPGGEDVAIEFTVTAGNATLVSPEASASVQVHSTSGEVRSTLQDGGPSSRVRVQGELQAGNFTARQGR